MFLSYHVLRFIIIRELEFCDLWDKSVSIFNCYFHCQSTITVNITFLTLEAIASHEQEWQEARYVDNNPVFET